TAGPNNTVALWACPERTFRQYLTPARRPAEIVNTRPMALAYSPDGKQLAALRGLTYGGNKNPPKGALLLRTWATDTGSRVLQQDGPHTLLGNKQEAWYSPVLAYSPDGKKLAAAYSTVPYSWDTLKDYRAATAREHRLPPPKETYADADGLSPSLIGILSDDGKMQAEIAIRNWGFARFAFTPDGGLAVWDGDARSVAIHGLSGKTPPRTVADFSGRNWFGSLRALAVTSDGKTLVALCTVNLNAAKKGSFHDNGTKIRIARFDLSAGGDPLESPTIDVVKKGTFELAADGRTFLAQSERSSVKVYDAATAQEIATLTLPDQRKVASVALSRSGRFIALSSVFGFMQVWELDRPHE
ncbi:MAG TPA: hypothetical protein VIK18_10795, partial [Pirellulales bacterium]